MRGRGLMLVAGMKAGEARAQQQYQAQAQQQAAVEQARQEGAAQAQQQAPAPATTDVTAELQKLADLHKQGVLTDDEFAAMKKKLLGL
jgi:membrane protease subunit (stomatin/prohibitin family)